MKTKSLIGLVIALIVTAPAYAGEKSDRIKAQEAEIRALRHRLAELETGTNQTGQIQDVACGETVVLPAPPSQPEQKDPRGEGRRPIAIARADGGALAVIIGPGWEDVLLEDFEDVPPPKKGERVVHRFQPSRPGQVIDRNKGTVNNTTINVVNSPGAQVTTASGKRASSRSASFPIKGERRHRAHGGRQIQAGCVTAGGMVTPSTYAALPGGLKYVAPYREHAFNENLKDIARAQLYEKALENYYSGRDVYTGEYPEEYPEEW